MEWTEGYTVAESGGLAVATANAGAPCPFCEGQGRRSLAVEGVTRVYRCRCQKLPDRCALFAAVQLPARHAACTMETFKAELARPTWVAVRRWLDVFHGRGDQQGLVISGEPGRGKTHLLAAAAREITFRYGVGVRFVEFSHLIASIREGYDRHVGEARLLGPLVHVPCLAIDELGKGRGSDFETTILDEIVSRRYNAHVGPLLATTNFPLRAARPRRDNDSLSTNALPTLAERLGDRVWSRLQESCVFVDAVGDDYRITRGRG
ncbi:MAG: ATP-binding protein [Myxococcales bacterium]|nr:ATP-binding protein [Myxococcales bacterium]